MKTVGSFEAKTHLAALLDQVAQGEIIMITRHGKPVARLVPPSNEGTKMSVEEAVAGLLEFRKAHPAKGLNLRDLIAEGRKH